MGLQPRVIAIDVARVQADARLAVAAVGLVRRGRGERDRRLGAGWRNLDPPILALERNVDALLEPELLDVKVDHGVLIADRNNHRRQLLDAALRVGAGHFILLGVCGHTRSDRRPARK